MVLSLPQCHVHAPNRLGAPRGWRGSLWPFLRLMEGLWPSTGCCGLSFHWCWWPCWQPASRTCRSRPTQNPCGCLQALVLSGMSFTPFRPRFVQHLMVVCLFFLPWSWNHIVSRFSMSVSVWLSSLYRGHLDPVLLI